MLIIENILTDVDTFMIVDILMFINTMYLSS